MSTFSEKVGGHVPRVPHQIAPMPTQSCKRASFSSLNPAGARNHKPKPGSSTIFILDARFRPKSKIYRGSYAQLWSITKHCVQV